MNYVTNAVVSGLILSFAVFFSAPLMADLLSCTPRILWSITSNEVTHSSRPGALNLTGIYKNEFVEDNLDVTSPAVNSTSFCLFLLS